MEDYIQNKILEFKERFNQIEEQQQILQSNKDALFGAIQAYEQLIDKLNNEQDINDGEL